MVQEANNHKCFIDNCDWQGQRAKWGKHALKKHVNFIIKEYIWQTTGGATNEDEIICNESLNSSICFTCGANYKYDPDLENIVIKKHYKTCSFSTQKTALINYMKKHKIENPIIDVTNKPTNEIISENTSTIKALEKLYMSTAEKLKEVEDDIDYWRERTCYYIEKCKEYSKVLQEHNIRDDIGID
jgi:hypothetical protein